MDLADTVKYIVTQN